MAREAVILHGVQKQYRDFKLGPLDLAVPAGTIVGLVGENGAGKTTTLRLLCGVSRPDAGQVTLLGGQPTDAARRRRIGVVFEDAYFFASLTARQIGKSMAGIFGDQWDAARFDGMLDRFGLDPKKKVQAYSRGMRMKLSLATALAHDPELLVLDEATAGLDPVVRGEMLDLFLEYIQDERHSILMSSHITSDLEQVADSIAYLHHGQLLFHEDKDTLLAEYKTKNGKPHAHRCPYTFDKKTGEFYADFGAAGVKYRQPTKIEDGKFTISFPVAGKQLILRFES